MDKHLDPVQGEVIDLAGGLFRVIGIPFEKTSELQRQLLAAFAFGMTVAVGQVHRLSSAEVHALALCCLREVFQYAEHQAKEFADMLSAAATQRELHPTLHVLIYRGIDGHLQWQQEQIQALKTNIAEIFKAAGA